MNGLKYDAERQFYASVVSASISLPVTESPKSGNSGSIYHDLIPLKLLFDAREYTIMSCSADKLLGALLLRILDSLPCVFLFHSPVPVKVASNYPNFLQKITLSGQGHYKYYQCSKAAAS